MAQPKVPTRESGDNVIGVHTQGWLAGGGRGADWCDEDSGFRLLQGCARPSLSYESKGAIDGHAESKRSLPPLERSGSGGLLLGRPCCMRIDAGIQEGGEITPWYDPMVAKLIAHGRDRSDAIRRLMAALEDSPLLGVRNNALFLRDLLDHPQFRAARMHTATIDQWMQDGEPLLQAPQADAPTWALAAAALAAQTSGA